MSNDEEYQESYDRRSSTDIPGFITETLHKAGEELLTIHANAIPGATRLEEGEERVSPLPNKHQSYHASSTSPKPSHHMTPAQASLARHAQQNPPNHHRSPASREASSERRRYLEYLDEEYAPKLPHAFDLGPKKNLIHLFGTNPWFWWLPVCNTSGDGWRWEVSEEWLRARERVAEERRQEEERHGIHGDYQDGDARGRGDGAGDGAGRYYYEGDRDYEQGSRYEPYDDYDDNQYDQQHHQSHRNQTFSPTPEDLNRRPSEAGSGLSMHTLNSQHQRSVHGPPNPKPKATSNSNNTKPPSQRARTRTELHRADTGEIESFQVSGSEASSSDEDEEDRDEWDDKVNGHGHRNGNANGDGNAVNRGNWNVEDAEEDESSKPWPTW